MKFANISSFVAHRQTTFFYPQSRSKFAKLATYRHVWQPWSRLQALLSCCQPRRRRFGGSAGGITQTQSPLRKSPPPVLGWSVEASSREIQSFLSLCCCQPGLSAQFQRLQLQVVPQIAGQGRLRDGMLLRSQSSCQFPVKGGPFQCKLLHDDFCNSTHGHLSPSVPAIFLRLSSAHTVAQCQFSTNLIITFDRNKIQTSNWHHCVSLVKPIRMAYNKALTDQVMTLIRGIFKFATSLYDLK